MQTVYVTAALVGIAGVLLIAYNPQKDTPAPGRPKSQAARLCGVCLVVLACFVVPITKYQYHKAQTSKAYAIAGGVAMVV
jgi:hypothetical protein